MDVERKNNYVKDNLFFTGEMAEWFKAADCKSVEVSHRRFESCSLHTFSMFFITEIF